MKNKHIIIVIFTTILILSFYKEIFAAWEVDIDAESSYNDKIRKVIIAKGNVKARAKDFYLESPYVKYYYEENKIVAEDKFFIDIEGYRISGSRLEYNFKDDTGVAGIVRVSFGNTFIGGSYLIFDKGKIEIYNAYFTGCNKGDSDYHVSANELVLYPKTGLIVAYWATAWIGAAPVIPVPTFVYSAPVPLSKFSRLAKKKLTEAEKRMKRLEEKKRIQPVPELRANPEDGIFLRQGFNWYLGPKWYAKFLISFIEKKGLGLSSATNYIINNSNEGEIRLGKNDGDGGYGGISHFLSFGPKVMPKEEESWQIYDTYKQGGKYAYELEVNQSFRERIHLEENIGPYNRVSFLPKVTLRSNRQPLPYVGEPFTYYMEVSSAKVSEESTSSTPGGGEAERKQFFADITLLDQQLWRLGTFRIIADYNSTDYPDVNRYWQRSTQRVELEHSIFDVVDLKIGHIHYYLQNGNGSPFAFENYEFSPFDQFLCSVNYKFWWSSFKYEAVYDLPEMVPFSVNYTLDFGMHCYDLVFNYRVVLRPTARTEFGFTFDLANSRWVEKGI